MYKASQDGPFVLTFPEAQRPWPKGTVGVIATGNDVKVTENDRPLRHHDLRIVPNSLMFAAEDSKEEESNSVDISRGKVRIGIVEPWQELTADEKAEALSAIGAPDAQHVLMLAEDREMKMDSRLRHMHVWDDVRYLPLVSECFQSGELFPGRRINELMNAVGGALNFLQRVETAKEQLQRQIDDPSTPYNRPIEHEHASYVTYFLQPLEAGLLPIPAQGMYLSASEHGRRHLTVTAQDMLQESAGKHFELDHFDVPRGYWDVRVRGEPATIEALRSLPDNDYFDTEFYAARGVRSLVSAFKIPKLAKPRDHRKTDRPSARLMSNLNIGEFAKPFEKDSEIAGYKRLSGAFRIKSLADVELPFFRSEGTVIEPFPQDAPVGVNPVMYKLLHRLEQQIVLSNRLALKPLFGHSAAGRPVMINHDVREQELAWYFDAAKFKTVSQRPDLIFESWSDMDSLRIRMQSGQWEADKFRPNAKSPAPYHLVNRESLQRTLGVPDLGFTVALLGSASSHIPTGNNDALRFTQLASAAGTTVIHGGGSRYIMRRFSEGAKLAMDEGHAVLNIGVRVPIASRKEGSVKPMIESFGLSVDAGQDMSAPHFTYGNGQFHIVTVPFYLGERQHIILGAADAVTAFIGGAGSLYEIFPTAYHNALVEHRGEGIFPGFNNAEKKRIFIVNSEVENGNGKRGFFDSLKGMFSEEDLAIMDIHFYATPEAAMEALSEYASARGAAPKPVSSETHEIRGL